MRQVEQHDLELYAINTGQFYTAHKQMAGQPLFTWLSHVRVRVVPTYSREIEPVWASRQTIVATAQNLKAYYERHMKEMAQ